EAKGIARDVHRELGCRLLVRDPVDLQSRAELTHASHRDRREGEELVLAGGLVLGRQINTSDVSLQLELGVGRLLGGLDELEAILGLQNLLVTRHGQGERPRRDAQLVSAEGQIGSCMVNLNSIVTERLPLCTVPGDLPIHHGLVVDLGKRRLIRLIVVDVVVVAVQVLVVDDRAVTGYVNHLIDVHGRAVYGLHREGNLRSTGESTAQINLQAPNALLTGTEREGQVRAVAADVDIAAEGEL